MRYILHSDLNNFFASVECLYDPSIRNNAVVVVGDVEKRSGVVLAKNNIAKKYGIKTGDLVWQAKQKCPVELKCVLANHDRYLKISHMVKDIYKEYSDRVESFGIDEAWIDISDQVHSFEEATAMANTIRLRVLDEIGLTVSVGVSFNKIFAKIGSDMKKPNAVTTITPDNFREKVWPLPVGDLLFVGHSTNEKLNRYNINTIKDLASCDSKLLKAILGKNGLSIQKFAKGLDDDPVKSIFDTEEVKSIGNSTTLPHDLVNCKEVESAVFLMAESVAKRMALKNLYAQCVTIWIRDSTLQSHDHQRTVPVAINSTKDITKVCMDLFKQYYTWDENVRAVGVRVSHLVDKPTQYDLFTDEKTLFRDVKMDKVVNELKNKYGYDIIKKGSQLTNNFKDVTVQDSRHQIHPIAYTRK